MHLPHIFYNPTIRYVVLMQSYPRWNFHKSYTMSSSYRRLDVDFVLTTSRIRCNSSYCIKMPWKLRNLAPTCCYPSTIKFSITIVITPLVFSWLCSGVFLTSLQDFPWWCMGKCAVDNVTNTVEVNMSTLKVYGEMRAIWKVSKITGIVINMRQVDQSIFLWKCHSLTAGQPT